MLNRISCKYLYDQEDMILIDIDIYMDTTWV